MSKLVIFVKDVYPHCLGDVVKLAEGELKSIETPVASRVRRGP